MAIIIDSSTETHLVRCDSHGVADRSSGAHRVDIYAVITTDLDHAEWLVLNHELITGCRTAFKNTCHDCGSGVSDALKRQCAKCRITNPPVPDRPSALVPIRDFQPNARTMPNLAPAKRGPKPTRPPAICEWCGVKVSKGSTQCLTCSRRHRPTRAHTGTT